MNFAKAAAWDVTPAKINDHNTIPRTIDAYLPRQQAQQVNSSQA